MVTSDHVEVTDHRSTTQRRGPMTIRLSVVYPTPEGRPGSATKFPPAKWLSVDEQLLVYPVRFPVSHVNLIP